MDDRPKDIAGAGELGSASHLHPDTGADIFHALSEGAPVEDTDMSREIRSRIRRSIDDPRPSLSLNQVDRFIDALVAKARADAGRA